jgi:hypothetical protein
MRCARLLPLYSSSFSAILVSVIALTQCLAASTSTGLNFAVPVTYNSGGWSTASVVVADVNGDGKPDIVVANHCVTYGACPKGAVGVLLGNGDGTFQTAVTYESGGGDSFSVAVADVNGDGKPDIVVTSECASGCISPGVVGVLLGNGDGTFQPVATYGSGGYYALSVAISDVNGDGKPDIVVANECTSGGNCNGSIGVLLNNGDGTFQTAVTYDSGGIFTVAIAVADVNGDGKPDIVTASECVNTVSPPTDCSTSNGSVGVLLGNGDGTFQTAVSYGAGGYGPVSVAVSDVNRDGKPDVVVGNTCSTLQDNSCSGTGTVGVLLGNGDGTFQTAVTYGSGGYGTGGLAIADMNGDGKRDILVASDCSSSNCTGNGVVGVLLGNGDGTFQTAAIFGSGGPGARSVAAADVNGDGKPDLVVSTAGSTSNGSVSVRINTSTTPTTTALMSSVNPSNFGEAVTFTATVTAHPGFYKGPPAGTASFYAGTTNLGNSNLNSSGVATLTISTLAVGTHKITAKYNGSTDFVSSTSSALSQLVQGAIAQFSGTSLNFGNQTVGIKSAAKTVTLTNQGNIALTISSMGITGTNSGDFDATKCPSSLAPNGTCTISVTFKPTATGTRTAAVSITDNAPGSPQKISLTGVGVLPAVAFSPASLTFPAQVIYTTSAAKTVKLTNSGRGLLVIGKIVVTGPFAQTNNCGSTVNSGSSCTLTVTFKPTAIGALAGSVSVSDNAPASPQKIALNGTATAIQLSPLSVSFGTQPVGTTSLSQTITLSNKSDAAVSITAISITGVDANDFHQTHTCGTTVASGASCFIKVTFKPLAKGARTAAVSVSDNGGGSPQKVSLTGTGT